MRIRDTYFYFQLLTKRLGVSGEVSGHSLRTIRVLEADADRRSNLKEILKHQCV